MQRNLDHRVETVFPLEAEPLKQRIVDEVLGIEMADTVKAQMLMPDGSYQSVNPPAGVSPLSAQRWFMEHSRDH
jgi:polyphosphate kinase